MNRRDFLKSLATLTGAVIVAPSVLTDTPVAPIPTVAIPIPSAVPPIPGQVWDDIFLTIDGDTYQVKAAELNVRRDMKLYLDTILYWTPQINRLFPLAITDQNRQFDIQIIFGREQVTYQLPMRLINCDFNTTPDGVEISLRLVGEKAQTV